MAKFSKEEQQAIAAKKLEEQLDKMYGIKSTVKKVKRKRETRDNDGDIDRDIAENTLEKNAENIAENPTENPTESIAPRDTFTTFGQEITASTDYITSLFHQAKSDPSALPSKPSFKKPKEAKTQTSAQIVVFDGTSTSSTSSTTQVQHSKKEWKEFMSSSIKKVSGRAAVEQESKLSQQDLDQDKQDDILDKELMSILQTTQLIKEYSMLKM